MTCNDAGRPDSDFAGLPLGGHTAEHPKTYTPEVLAAFPNRHPEAEAWTSLLCSEFTSLCPKTGQPDFARITVNYIAGKLMVESKSMKLYLFSFRNHGAFHEDCVQMICDDLHRLLNPKFIEVVGDFHLRGGIGICPYTSHACGEERFQRLKEQRLAKYAPGAYSAPAGKLYST